MGNDTRGQITDTPTTLALVTAQIQQALRHRVDEIACAVQQWSASGAVPFSGTWRATGTPVLIKVGVDRNQLYWTRQMAATAPDLVPVLYASGAHVGALPIGWTVMERIAFGPLGSSWHGHEFAMLLEAAVRFQSAARAITPRHLLATMDAPQLRQWLERGLTSAPPGPAAVILRRVEQDVAWVSSVCSVEVCHGDVHLCNALTRTPPPDQGSALLIDCQPRRQPWACDAASLQVLNSLDRRRTGYTDLVQTMARVRAQHAMPSCAGCDLDRLARITLAWFAIHLWGLCPDRHTIADYQDETERYITESAVLV